MTQQLSGIPSSTHTNTRVLRSPKGRIWNCNIPHQAEGCLLMRLQGQLHLLVADAEIQPTAPPQVGYGIKGIVDTGQGTNPF